METMDRNANLNNMNNLEESQTLEFIENDIKINLSFLYNDKLIIFKVTHFSLPPNEYELSISLEKLYHINRYFNNFDKSIDLINSLIETYNDKKLKIIFKENICNLIIYNPITKKTFELQLNKKEKNFNSQLEDLINIIKDDRKRIETLENKVAKLENIILELNKKDSFFNESNILNEEEKNLLINWFEIKPILKLSIDYVMGRRLLLE